MTYSESVNNILGQISKEPEVIKEITFWKKNKDRLGYESAEAFSKVLGTATAKHLSPIAEQMNPEEIKTVYQYVSDLMIKYCEDATASITGRAGLKFVPDVKTDVKSDINDMLDNLVTRMYDTDSWEDVKFLANENSARSITRKTTTSHMNYTARSQQRAGVKVLISRTGGAECCDYCAGLTGTFTSLEDLPDNFWSVHRNCTCSFHYNVGKTNDIITFSTDEYGNVSKATEGIYKEEIIPTNKNGKEIQFNWKDSGEQRKEQEKVITKLSNEYNTRLETVTSGSEKSAGDVDITGAKMRLADSHISTAIHEFAHTLANSNAEKYGLTKDSDFWKEIAKIRREYHKDVDKTQDASRWISSYEHSSKSVDEFLAEAFAQIKMMQLGYELPSKYGSDLTYSQKVLEVVDKYFKK